MIMKVTAVYNDVPSDLNKTVLLIHVEEFLMNLRNGLVDSEDGNATEIRKDDRFFGDARLCTLTIDYNDDTIGSVGRVVSVSDLPL